MLLGALGVAVQQGRHDLLETRAELNRGELGPSDVAERAVLQIQSDGQRGRPIQVYHPETGHNVRVAHLHQKVPIGLQRVTTDGVALVALQDVRGAVLVQTVIVCWFERDSNNSTSSQKG